MSWFDERIDELEQIFQEKTPSVKIEMHEKKPKLPTIPEGYVIDKPHYLSIGEGVYVLIKMQKMILMISGLL